MEEYKYTLAQGDTLVSPARKDKSGKVIAPERTYIITEVLGQGGFGITYKAEARVRTRVGNIEQKVKMEFAIKEFFMKDSCERDAVGCMRYSNPVRESVEDGLHSFISEAQRLNDICKLNHNIVDVNEVFEANGTAYFVMEYLDGGDLRQLVSQNRGKGLPEEQALAIIRPIAEAMQAVHKEKILHLDIKPDNIVLRRGDDGSSEPVLIDFGLSIHFNNKGNVTSTRKTGGFSRGYSPKEQYAPIEKFAPELDVYALAATLLYLLTGKDPDNAFDMKDGDVQKTLASHGVKLSDTTLRALVHAMQPDKDARTKDMETFQEELKPEEPKVDPEKHSSSSKTKTFKLKDKETGGEPSPKPKVLGVISRSLLIKFGVAAVVFGAAFGIKQCIGASTGPASSVKNNESVATEMIDSVVPDTSDIVTPTAVTAPSTSGYTKDAGQNVVEEQLKAAEAKVAAEKKAKQEAKKKERAQEQAASAKTDGALAREYAQKGDYATAAAYVRKALKSNSGRADAITANKYLETIGAYDNGANGGNPLAN